MNGAAARMALALTCAGILGAPVLECAQPGHAVAGVVRSCASCHTKQTKFFAANSMSHALETVAECDILSDHPLLTFKNGPYSYKIERQGNGSLYTVTDGHESLTVPLGWAFGLGSAGQTYLFEKDGSFYESRVSYYKETNALDLTMGAANAKPANLTEAAGRDMGDREPSLCFNCHATNSVAGFRLTLDRMTPGVQCERCHGPTAQHLAGLKQGDASHFAMKKLGAMSTEEISNFCGQCHRTWEQISMNGPKGIVNVRFQPYRLTKSKCYDTEDKRISCVACHDPHKPLDHTLVNYDAKCQTCHQAATHTGTAAKLCKVGTKDCASCHMPKIELPGAHHRFTDHMIRIARAGAVYPD